MSGLWNRFDTWLGRYPMYRVVSVALGALAVVALVLALTERLDPTVFAPEAMLLSLVVLGIASVGSNLVLGRLRGLRVHPESSLITALLLWFLYWPSDDPTVLAFLAAAAVLANLSKYLLRWRDTHLFNPAAAGVVLLALIGYVVGPPDQLPYTTWWVGSQVLLPWVAVAALVLFLRLRRFLHALVFVVVATAATMVALHDSQALPWGDGLRFALESSPIVFFAAFMLTEPLTLAPRRVLQVLAAVVAAVVFTLPLTVLAAGYLLDLAPVGGSYEIALLAANLVAVIGGQQGARLRVLGTREVGGDTLEVRMAPRRRLRFTPGQYLELDVADAGASSDQRGLRRVLSISSPPGEDVTVAVRVPERPSAFKTGLQALAEGDRVRATSLGGDFVWPRGGAPLLLVAGGIGVTPYLSQLRSPAAQGRDVVLVYGCGPDDVPYRDELAATPARVVLVAPSRPAELPDGWTYVASPVITREVIDEAVPDHGARRAFVSGPPAMVNALRTVLPRARFDHFSGY